MLRVIIQAAGEQKRWANYRGLPKHFLQIDGKPLLNRMIDQAKRYTKDIYVVGPDIRYKIQGCGLLVPENQPEWFDTASFMSSQALWSDERTVILAGDVYYTEQAIKLIFEHDEEWRWVARLTPSSFTGCSYKETFGLNFARSYNETLKYYLDLIAKAEIKKLANYVLMHYMTGQTISKARILADVLKMDSPFVKHLDDWTEDFDFPRDIEAWEENRKIHLERGQSW